jgi:hypothetical protein
MVPRVEMRQRCPGCGVLVELDVSADANAWMQREPNGPAEIFVDFELVHRCEANNATKHDATRAAS